MFNAWPSSVDWLCDLSWLGWEGPVFFYITCFCHSSSWWADNIAIMCMDVWCTTGFLTLVVASFGWDKRVQCSYITCFWISSSWWADGERTNVAVQDVWCTASHRCSYITCFWISSSWWADGERTDVAVQDVWCTASHRCSYITCFWISSS